MGVAAAIELKLQQEFSPVRLEIFDESHLHAGHAGARPQGESHFRVEIVSRAFADTPRLERQRAVYRILSDEMASDIHALALTTLTPEEDAAP